MAVLEKEKKYILLVKIAKKLQNGWDESRATALSASLGFIPEVLNMPDCLSIPGRRYK